MNQAMQFLDKLRNDPKAKELVTGLKMPESEEETARVYLGLAEKMGFNLTAEEILAAVKTMSQEQRSKTAEAAGSVDKAPLSEDALEAVAGGRDGDGEPIDSCDGTHVPGEWCWFNDSCSYLIWSYEVEPDPISEKELNKPANGTAQEIQYDIYAKPTPEGIQEYIYDF